jgi:hypothetical protein
MEGFNLKGKKIRLSINLYTSEKDKLDYLNLIGRYYKLKKMFEKRELILQEWNTKIHNLLISDLENIKSELLTRQNQLQTSQLKIQSKDVYKISLDVQTQKNGSKFYRGRIKIPQSDRNNFHLKTPRKEFLIKRNEMKILVSRMNHLKQDIPLSIINRPVKILKGVLITRTKIGGEMQYLIYEKYINFLKSKLTK